MRAIFLFLAAMTALGAALVLNHASAQSRNVSIGSLTLNLGDQGSVDLQAHNTADPVGAWDIEIVYDPAVVSVVDCAVTEESVCDAESTDGSIRVAGASTSGFVGDFTLATITFRCESEGESSLSLTLIVFGEAIGFPPTPEAHNGSITCQEAPEPTPTPTLTVLIGDVDEDGIINSLDALWVLWFDAILLAVLPPPSFVIAADVNEDGTIDSTDATLILQFDAGLIPALPTPAGSAIATFRVRDVRETIDQILSDGA